MSKRAVPNAESWPGIPQIWYKYLEERRNSVDADDVSDLSDISSASTTAEIGAALAAFYTKATQAR